MPQGDKDGFYRHRWYQGRSITVFKGVDPTPHLSADKDGYYRHYWHQCQSIIVIKSKDPPPADDPHLSAYKDPIAAAWHRKEVEEARARGKAAPTDEAYGGLKPGSRIPLRFVEWCRTVLRGIQIMGSTLLII